VQRPIKPSQRGVTHGLVGGCVELAHSTRAQGAEAAHYAVGFVTSFLRERSHRQLLKPRHMPPPALVESGWALQCRWEGVLGKEILLEVRQAQHRSAEGAA
jgi:hypothetical protein